MNDTDVINQATTDGHAAVFYDKPAERTQLLARYFQDGLQNNELCIYVTAEPISVAIQQLRTNEFDPEPAIKDASLRIFVMNDTYLPDGHFAAKYMLENVRSYQHAATALGYSGLRTAGEMTWLYDHPESLEEAHAYEHSVNTLRNPQFIGLCLYPVQEHFAQVLQSVTATHPTFIYGGSVRTNPYYV